MVILAIHMNRRIHAYISSDNSKRKNTSTVQTCIYSCIAKELTETHLSSVIPDPYSVYSSGIICILWILYTVLHAKISEAAEDNDNSRSKWSADRPAPQP